MVTTKELAGERNELVLSIAKDFGEKLGLEPLIQEACTDMLTGIRISEVVLAFSEGLRTSVPLTGKVLDRDDVIQEDEGEVQGE